MKRYGKKPKKNIDYGYDANGNRSSRNVTDGLSTQEATYEYATDSHHLLSVNTTENLISSERTFSYNAAGNLIEDASPDRILTMNYSQQNRLEEVQQTDPATDSFGGLLGSLGGELAPPETLALYLHNALGQRVVKVATDPAANTHFQYNLAGQLIGETSASGELVREYLYLNLNGTPVAMLEADNAQ
ncbi:hypothetical protein [Marinobacter sp.]|uniref:hypothetical protein n=1 Tax=Marinobacter sp. TaxID=50741 RepID=UPI0034A0E4E3